MVLLFYISQEMRVSIAYITRGSLFSLRDIFSMIKLTICLNIRRLRQYLLECLSCVNMNIHNYWRYM
jgi:Trp operon repressor